MKKFYRILDNISYMISMIFKEMKIFLIYMMAYGAIVGLLYSTMDSMFFKFIIDAMTSNKGYRYAILMISLYAAAGLVLVVLRHTNWYISGDKEEITLSKVMQEKLLKKAKKLDLSCYDDPEFYNDFVIAYSESESRAKSIIFNLKNLMNCITSIITMSAIIAVLDYIVFIILIVSFIIALIIQNINNKISYKYNIEMQKKARKRDYYQRIFYLPLYAKEIRITQIGNKLIENFRLAIKDMRKSIETFGYKIAFISFVSSFFTEKLIEVATYFYLSYCVFVTKNITPGDFVALLVTCSRFSETINWFSSIISQFVQDSLYIENLRKFLEYEPRIRSGKLLPNIKGSDIIIKNVSFAYNQKSEYILKNINMSIKQGEKIAIVGHNGAGKTTFIKLLMRLYDVSYGTIELDDINIKEYDCDEYRKQIGVIFQDFQIFAASIAENVLMDLSVNENDRQNTISALTNSGFDFKLNTFEKGIDTIMTREFVDEGVILSGGENQKIAIARAFAKNCSIMILDEPSSALDPIAEYNLNQTLLKVAKDKTVIFISHRLSTTRLADTIYMIENGEIIEYGSHNELMSQDGKYSKMFNMQAKKYE